jgi:hypothetical protein
MWRERMRNGKKSIRIENFFSLSLYLSSSSGGNSTVGCCSYCSNAISLCPRDDNDEDVEREFVKKLFLSLSHYVLIILAMPTKCVCVKSLKIEL